MSENETQDQKPTELDEAGNPLTPEAVVARAEASLGLDAEKLAAIRAKIKKFVTSDKKTISGSEAPTEGALASENTGSVTTGKDVDWSEYNLEYSVRHLYKDAAFRMTPQGPKWVAMLDEFHSTERDWKNYGKRVNVPGTTDGADTEPLNLGQYLNDMLNSPEGWKLISVLPTGSGRAGVLLQRSVPYILPDPEPLKKETEVAAPTDPEIKKTEDASLEFMEKEGLTPPPLQVDDGLGDLRPRSVEEQVLSINPPTERIPTGENKEPDMAKAAGEAVAQQLADGTIRVLPEREESEEA